MSKDFQCPYCGSWQEHDTDQSKSGPLHQTSCFECEKSFVFSVEYYPTFSVHKADCLNGAPHDYKDRLEGNEYYQQYFSKWIQCRDCDHEIREAKENAA